MEKKNLYGKFQELINLFRAIDTTRLVDVTYSTTGETIDGDNVVAIKSEVVVTYATDKDKLQMLRLIENEEWYLEILEAEVERQKEAVEGMKARLGEVDEGKTFKKRHEGDEGRVGKSSKGIWGTEKR
jgi:hypothetical protein